MIIGILGLIGSGKNTAAEEFIKIGYEKDSFAATLKDVCSAMFGWRRDLLEGITDESRAFREAPDMFWNDRLGAETLAKFNVGPSYENKYFTPRIALQLLGTNVLRDQFHNDIWINTVEHRLQQDPSKNIVISDCRFKNEIALIREHGGILIRVDRGPNPDWHEHAVRYNKDVNNFDAEMEGLYQDKNRLKDVHQSEWDWVGTDVDYVIDNNGTLADMKARVAEIANDIRRNPGRTAQKTQDKAANIARQYQQ